jgi:hypothetical protein
MDKEYGFVKMTDEELKQEALSSFFDVFFYCCYGSRDIWVCDKAVAELERRGYEVFEAPKLIIQKPDDDNRLPRPEKDREWWNQNRSYSLEEATQILVKFTREVHQLVHRISNEEEMV